MFWPVRLIVTWGSVSRSLSFYLRAFSWCYLALGFVSSWVWAAITACSCFAICLFHPISSSIIRLCAFPPNPSCPSWSPCFSPIRSTHTAARPHLLQHPHHSLPRSWHRDSSGTPQSLWPGFPSSWSPQGTLPLKNAQTCQPPSGLHSPVPGYSPTPRPCSIEGFVVIANEPDCCSTSYCPDDRMCASIVFCF